MQIKHKILATFITATLLISALTLTANADIHSYSAQLTTTNSGTAELLDISFGAVIHLYAPSKAVTTANKGTIILTLPENTTLGDITSIQWSAYTMAGYPPHADLKLDIDDDGTIDETLVFEYAYQPYTGSGYEYNGTPGVPYGHYDPAQQGAFYNPPYDTWVQTFQNDTSEAYTDSITNISIGWLGSGLPGPYAGGYFGSLADFKAGAVTVINGTDAAPVNSSTLVLEIRIEVDNWIGESDAYVKDVELNGETLVEPSVPTVEIMKPAAANYPQGDIPLEITAWDIFGIDHMIYNIKDGGDNWVYGSNQTYSGPLNITGLAPDTYKVYAWATNNLGLTSMDTRSFKVITTTGIKDKVTPRTLNLRSNGKWITVKIVLPAGVSTEGFNISQVRLEVNGHTFEPVWGKVHDNTVIVKFRRSEVQGALEEGQYTVEVTGVLPSGSSFAGTDTIRVIKPGNGNMKAHQNSRRNGPGPKGFDQDYDDDHPSSGNDDHEPRGKGNSKGKNKDN